MATASRNYAAALLAERQAALAAAQAQANYQRATSASAMAGRAALGLLGSPAGLAITVGMVAAGWLMFRDNTDAAASAVGGGTPRIQVSIENKGEPMQIGSASAERAPDGTLILRLLTASMRKAFANGEMGDMMSRYGVQRRGISSG